MLLATMSGGDWILLILATITAAGIVKCSKMSNWMMIPIVPIAWALSYILLWVLKWTIVMAIILGAGLGLWYYIYKITTPTPPKK